METEPDIVDAADKRSDRTPSASICHSFVIHVYRENKYSVKMIILQ